MPADATAAQLSRLQPARLDQPAQEGKIAPGALRAQRWIEQKQHRAYLHCASCTLTSRVDRAARATTAQPCTPHVRANEYSSIPFRILQPRTLQVGCIEARVVEVSTAQIRRAQVGTP